MSRRSIKKAVNNIPSWLVGLTVLVVIGGAVWVYRDSMGSPSDASTGYSSVTTVYVATNGDDTNTGISQANPLRTLNKAVQTIPINTAPDSRSQLKIAIIGSPDGTYVVPSDKSLIHSESKYDVYITSYGRSSVTLMSDRSDWDGIIFENYGEKLTVSNVIFKNLRVGLDDGFLGGGGSRGFEFINNTLRQTAEDYASHSMISAGVNRPTTKVLIQSNRFLFYSAVNNKSYSGVRVYSLNEQNSVDVVNNSFVYPSPNNASNTTMNGVLVLKHPTSGTGTVLVAKNNFTTTGYKSNKPFFGKQRGIVTVGDAHPAVKGNVFSRFAGTPFAEEKWPYGD